MHKTRPVAGDVPVALASVNLSVARLSCVNTAERFEVLMATETFGDARNIVVDVRAGNNRFQSKRNESKLWRIESPSTIRR